MPLYRQEERFEQEGVPLERGTMSRWMNEPGGTLGATLWHVMKIEAMRTALCLTTDATGILVQQGRDLTTGALRVSRSSTVTPSSSRTRTRRRARPAVAELFRGFSGYVQADAMSVYDILFRGPDERRIWTRSTMRDGSRSAAGRTRAATSSRRRPSRRARRARSAVSHPAARRDRRALLEGHTAVEAKDATRPIPEAEIDLFFAFARDDVESVQDQRGLHRSALVYVTNEKTALRRILEDGRLKMDNNASACGGASRSAGRTDSSSAATITRRRRRTALDRRQREAARPRPRGVSTRHLPSAPALAARARPRARTEAQLSCERAAHAIHASSCVRALATSVSSRIDASTVLTIQAPRSGSFVAITDASLPLSFGVMFTSERCSAKREPLISLASGIPLQLAHDRPTHLVERVVREPLDVEAIEHDLGVRCVLLHRALVRLRHVHRDQFELRGSLAAEDLEEAADRLAALALADPDDARAVVIDDDGHVLVVLTERELVEADAREPIEHPACVAELPRHHAFDDLAHRRPRDPHVLRDARLVRTLCLVGNELLEVVRVPRAVVGPRNELRRRPAPRASHACEREAEVHARFAQVRVPRLARSVVVRGAAPTEAVAAERRARRGAHVEHDRLPRGVDLEAGDDGVLRTQT